MRKPVTTDISVLQGWPKSKSGQASSAQVAEALGITVFQITARLKGMEGRGFVARDNGVWTRTEKGLAEAKNPSPSVVKKPAARLLNALGFATGAPDDSKVPMLELSREDWAPSEFAFNEARKRLPIVKRRLAEFKEQGNHQGIMALRTELDHCRAILKRPRDGCWYHKRIVNGPHLTEVYVAPDMREYVKAESFEIADVRLAMSSGFEPVRLRLYTTSILARRDAKATQEDEGRKAAKLEKRKKNAEEAETVVPADDTGDGWRRLTKKERKEERFRARAESSFWNLPEEKRDRIRASGKWDSYEAWYRHALQRAKKRTG